MYGRNLRQEEEDERLARQLQEEENSAARRQADNNPFQTTLEQLQENLDSALAIYLQAQYDGRTPANQLEELQRLYEQAQARLAAHERQRVYAPAPVRPPVYNPPVMPMHVPNMASNNFIHDRLDREFVLMNPQAQAQPVLNRAKAHRVFTAEELAKIRSHSNNQGKVAEHLQKLIDAALNDDAISLDLINNPVFIRGDVRIYDHDVLKDFLHRAGGAARCPTDDKQRFRESDIIPCNTLIKAMEQLLNIIDNKPYTPPIKYSDILFANANNRSRANISPEIVNLIEMYYDKHLLDRQKALFDIICRDPVTGMIMDDPVYLPDGYVYDRSTVTFCKRLAGANKSAYPCPGSDNQITFTDADVTPCYFVKNVLEQLSKNVLAIRAMMQQAALQNNVREEEKAPSPSM